MSTQGTTPLALRQRAAREIVDAAQELRGDLIRRVAAARSVTRRTVRRWVAQERAGIWGSGRPGPAPVVLDRETRQGIIALLVVLGPMAGVASVRAVFGDVPYRMLGEMKRRLARVRARRARRRVGRLVWCRAGTVWAMDFTKPKARLSGKHRMLFVVRDLASGMRLASVPCKGERAEVVISTLSVLFATHGAPLVMKHDNGPGFNAQVTRALLKAHGVERLPSPAYTPSYNGAMERSLGWDKVQCEHLAELAGHPGVWPDALVERARQQANRTLRPWGARGPTPEMAFEVRRAILGTQRDAFQETVAQEREAARKRAEASGATMQRASVHDAQQRRAVRRALVHHGYLKIRRGRESTPFPAAQADMNS